MGGIVDSIFGGGPDVPDPMQVSAAESKANTEAARVTAALNRANQITPLGSLTWAKTPGQFNATAYQQAMDKYYKDLAAYQSGGGGSSLGWLYGGGLGGAMDREGYGAGLFGGGGKPVMPNQSDFMSGDPDSWTSTVTLDPRVQALLDQQLKSQVGQGQALDSATSRVNALGDVAGLQLPDGPMPTANDVYRKQIQDAVYGQMTSRLDPQFAQRESDLTSRLAAQGITQGSQAYDREFGNLGRDRNDAYQTAMNNAFTQGEAAVGNQFGRDMGTRQQGVSEAQAEFGSGLQGRSQVLNELQGLRSGQQVAMPQFGSTQSGASVAPANVGANTWNAYNAGQAQQAAGTQGLTSLGMAAMMAPTGTFSGLASGLASLFSDRRLKSNITRIGTHPLGIGLYEYDIFGTRQRGVMADEVEQVLPEAVSTHESGFKMVNYGML